MSLTIKDAETVNAIRRLATKGGRSEEDVVRTAVEAELLREAESDRILQDIRRIRAEVALWPRTGLKADKAFFDDLGGGL